MSESKNRWLKLPSQEQLKKVLDYDRNSGDLRWKIYKSKRIAGGHISVDGHKRVKVDGVLYLAHRLIWMYVYGKDPEDMTIDHRDGNGSNNKLSNLRLADLSTEQSQNKRVKGVHFMKRLNKWVARVQHKGKRLFLGAFATEKEAIETYQLKKKELCGEFSPY